MRTVAIGLRRCATYENAGCCSLLPCISNDHCSLQCNHVVHLIATTPQHTESAALRGAVGVGLDAATVHQQVLCLIYIASKTETLYCALSDALCFK